MRLINNVDSYLKSRGMYTQAYDNNSWLLKNFEIDLIYKFYTCFDRVGMNEGYGNSRVIYLPFILYVGDKLVTFEYTNEAY